MRLSIKMYWLTRPSEQLRVNAIVCGIETLRKAMTNAIKLSKIVVNGPKRVVGFTGNLILGFAFDIMHPADDALVRDCSADIVESPTTWHDTLVFPFVKSN